jgi:thymidylate synthase (FAD)
MKVDLVHITPKAEEQIVYTARVSNPSNQSNMDTAPRLIKYLIKHKHWSPFEMSSMCLEIETSRAIAAQILRHRSFVFQEFSQRYSSIEDLGFELYEPRRQDLKNRQNSINDLSPEDQDWYLNTMIDINEQAKLAYKEALNRGIAKECARFLLPLNTKTRIYVNGSVRSWIHYIQVRTDPSTQLEHREIAEECKRIFVEQLPNVAEALEWK